MTLAAEVTGRRIGESQLRCRPAAGIIAYKVDLGGWPPPYCNKNQGCLRSPGEQDARRRCEILSETDRANDILAMTTRGVRVRSSMHELLLLMQCFAAVVCGAISRGLGVVYARMAGQSPRGEATVRRDANAPAGGWMIGCPTRAQSHPPPWITAFEAGRLTLPRRRGGPGACVPRWMRGVVDFREAAAAF
jgi:hypothetical protein